MGIVNYVSANHCQDGSILDNKIKTLSQTLITKPKSSKSSSKNIFLKSLNYLDGHYN